MVENFNLGSLESLTGKVVRLYKAGPESTIGRLVAVNNDHLVVDTANDGGIVFYNTAHIKSVCEDLSLTSNGGQNGSQNGSQNGNQNSKQNKNKNKNKNKNQNQNQNNNQIILPSEKPADFYARYTQAVDMNELLQNFKYSVVRVDRGGPEARIGRLLETGEDYICLYTQEDGILYYQTHHVKSISEVTFDNYSNNGNNNNNNNNNNNSNYRQLLDQFPNHISGETMMELFQNMQNYWVKINRGGPESVEGVLADVADDHIVLVSNKEVYRIATFHIRNISYQDKNVINMYPNNTDLQKKKKLLFEDLEE